MAKVIFSPAENELEMPFEGTTYIIPPKKDVLVENEGFVSFLKETLPWIEVKEPKREKEPYFVTKAKTKKTPVYREVKPTSDFVARKIALEEDLGVDGLPPSGMVDKDGVEWIGEGVQKDSI